MVGVLAEASGQESAAAMVEVLAAASVQESAAAMVVASVQLKAS